MGIKRVLLWKKILVYHPFSNVIPRMNLSVLWNTMKRLAGIKTNGLFGEDIQSNLFLQKPIFRGLIGKIPLNEILIISQ